MIRRPSEIDNENPLLVRQHLYIEIVPEKSHELLIFTKGIPVLGNSLYIEIGPKYPIAAVRDSSVSPAMTA